jgi:hypothetical protein
MLWFFERDDETLRLETRFDNDTSEFVVIVRYPDGHQHTERFSDLAEFGNWVKAFEGTLEHQRWTRPGHGPIFLPDGWPKKRLS